MFTDVTFKKVPLEATLYPKRRPAYQHVKQSEEKEQRCRHRQKGNTVHASAPTALKATKAKTDGSKTSDEKGK